MDTPWPGGPIALSIDASDTRRALYRVTETIPVPADMRTLTLLYPKWLPGNHAASGPISLVSDIHFTANGKPLAWKRNALDVYQFDVTVPAGVREVTASFIHTSPVAGNEGRVTMTQEMLNLQWDKMSFYPAGHYTRRIAITPTVKFPDGWKVFTALDGQRSAGATTTWAPTDYETLVDSPVFAGEYAKQWPIGDKVHLDVVADKLGELAITPDHLAHFSKLIDEADALFGARHFDHYDMLLALTDRMGGIGLEHHRSAENSFEPDSLTKWDEMDWDHNVVAHELTHSWNGKFRRPRRLVDTRLSHPDAGLAAVGLRRTNAVLGLCPRRALGHPEEGHRAGPVRPPPRPPIPKASRGVNGAASPTPPTIRSPTGVVRFPIPRSSAARTIMSKAR